MASIREPHAEIVFTTPPEPFDEETPELVTCIVARCNQVVEIQNTDGSANPEAVSTVPAVLTFFSATGEWTAEDGDALTVRINNGILQTMAFSAAPTTDEFIIGTYDQQNLKDALERAYAGASAKIVGTTTVLLFSDTSGDTSKIEVVSQVDGSPTSPMFPEIVDGMIVVGQSHYTNAKMLQRDIFLPDPRELGEDKKVDADSLRAFVRRNNALVEFDDESALMIATRSIAKTAGIAPYDDKSFSLKAVDDGDTDNYTPWVAAAPIQAELLFDGIQYTVLETATTDAGLTAIGAVGNVFTITIVDTGLPGPATAVRATDAITIDLNGAADKDTLVSDLSSDPVFITVMTAEVLSGGTGAASLTTVPLALEGYDAHNWRDIAGGTAAVTVDGGVDIVSGYDFSTVPKQFSFSLNGGRAIDVTLNQAYTLVQLLAALNAAVSDDDPFTSVLRDINQDGVDETVMQVNYTPATLLYGRDSSIRFWGTAVPFILGPSATYEDTFFGRPHDVDYGDEVLVDGELIGTVVGFADYVDGDYSIQNGILILDTEVSNTYDKSAWFVKAKNLQPTDATNVRPRADLYVDGADGWYTLKDNVVTDYAGHPVDTTNLVYIGYTALRADIGDDIVAYNTLEDVEANLGPISIENPFGLMFYLALSESQGQTVTGIAVKDFSSTEPDGTETSYAYALEVLTSKNVNRLVSGSQRQEINELFDAHGAEMFEQEYSRGRLLYYGELLPSEMPPTVIGSGNSNSAGGADAQVTFDSNDVVVEDVIRDAGIDPNTLTVADGVFISVVGSTDKYVLQAVNGQIVTVKTTGFVLGENDDDFWSRDNFPALIDQTASLYVRGDLIEDRDAEIDALVMMASHYTYDGSHFIQPDSCAITLYGVDYRVDNRYLAAIVAGGSSRLRASKSLNGMQLYEANVVYGSNDRYSQEQLNIAQGGGVFWIENYKGATEVRMQVTCTTERSNIIAAKVYLLDYWRLLFKDYFRTEEISTQLQENLSTKIEGGVEALLRARIVKEFDFLRIEQDPDDERGLIGYANCELFQPFEKFIFEIKLI